MATTNPTPKWKDIKQHVQDALDQREQDNLYQPSPIPSHVHNGTDSQTVDQNSITQGPNGYGKQYFAREFDNGKVTTTAVIDWSQGNVQYVTLTGNTTFTFRNAQPGMRAILQVAGAYTPTFPANVRWSAGTTPTATATVGYKDIYSFVYSGKESLYDGIQSANFATT